MNEELRKMLAMADGDPSSGGVGNPPDVDDDDDDEDEDDEDAPETPPLNEPSEK